MNRRSAVAWIGECDPAIATEIERRDLELRVHADVQDALSDQDEARAVVVQFSDQRPRDVMALGAIAPQLVNNGVVPIVLTRMSVAGFLTRLLLSFDRGRNALIKWQQEREPHEIARVLHALPDTRRARTDLKISGLPTDVEEVVLALLRRSFNDCSRLEMEELVAGKSNKGAWIVYATLDDGARAMPFFVKADKLVAVDAEKTAYQSWVDTLVPFALRPQLDLDRCVSGADIGIVVGRFVAGSEELTDVARRGLASGAIHSLFDTTLRGWRMQAKPATAGINSNLYRPDKLPAARVRAAMEIDANVAGVDTLTALLDRPRPARFGPIHGDLHTANVRVRGNDAILIDFEKASEGPLCFDPACLEVSLAFVRRGDDTNDGWEKAVSELYDVDQVLHPSEPHDRPAHLDWMTRAVCHVRMIALAYAGSPEEYGWALVAALLRHARFATEGPSAAARRTDDQRKVIAYVLASRLALALRDRAATRVAPA